MWVTAVLVALRRLREQTGILAASGEFRGSFNCSEFELTSQKIFGKLCFNILCPGQRDVELILFGCHSSTLLIEDTWFCSFSFLSLV